MVGNICNDYGGICSIYVVGLKSHTFVVIDVSATGSCFNLHIINPLKAIVINYQNGGDRKCMYSPCVVLVINDNHYGLMFALSST